MPLPERRAAFLRALLGRDGLPVLEPPAGLAAYQGVAAVGAIESVSMCAASGGRTHERARERAFVPGFPKPQGSKRHVGNGRMAGPGEGSGNWRAQVS